MIDVLDTKDKIEFMKKASRVSHNSTCGYKVGAVGVFYTNELDLKEINNPYINRYKDGLWYIKAWNITLPGEIYCQEKDEKGNKVCIRVKEGLKGKDIQMVCSCHAEVSLISKCARYGIPTEGMIMFITNSPCIICARAIYIAGIKEVYYMSEYTDLDGLRFLKKSGLPYFQLKGDEVFK